MDRDKVAAELQPTLVELVDLALSGKQAHWNLTGELFRPLHLQLDELVVDAREWGDQVAERLVTVGVPADGRVATVAADTPLPAFPSGAVPSEKVVTEIVARLDDAVERVRGRIARLGDVDPVSQDLLTGITAGLEKHRWMFVAQSR